MSNEDTNLPPHPHDYSQPEEGEEISRSNPGNFRASSDIAPIANLSNVQSRAIELALQGLRDSQIAKALALSPKTLWRWKTQNDDYRQALADARIQLHQAATDRCQTYALSAAVVLSKFLTDENDKNRFRAAHILLSAASRFKSPTPPKEKPPEIPFEPWPMPVLPPKVG
jgi:Homeodomain-like domain